MVIEMFNAWYFLWLGACAGLTVGLYFALRKASPRVQKLVFFSILAFGFLLHFLKAYIPPYSVDEARKLRDSWFVNICGANIALFPFFIWAKNKHIKDYMFYVGVLSGLIALFYPQEPLAKSNQMGEFWDIVRFYYHHWQLIAVPLLMVLLRLHTLSYRRILSAPIGILLLMLFIILNQFFQAELGFIPIRGAQGFDHVMGTDYWEAFYDVNWKNTSYIYGPDLPDAIGKVFSIFCPKFFKVIPVGPYAGQEKYWPWFWMIFPVFILLTPLAFGLCMIFDHKNFAQDMKKVPAKWRNLIAKIKSWKGKKNVETVECENVEACEVCVADDTSENTNNETQN